MSVYLCIPSKRPLAEANKALDRWREMGYKLALLRDEGDDPHPACDILVTRTTYPGWGASANLLGRTALERDLECDWCVVAGDDTYPDPNRTPGEIAEECSAHFCNAVECNVPSPGGSGRDAPSWKRWSTFGVMQPTGDPWGEESEYNRRFFPDHPRNIERIAGSPWIGREYFLRVNGGRGPIWEEYRAMYDDEELQCVATLLGAFWQAPHLTHYHDHWVRRGIPCPDFSRHWNSPAHFNANRELFHRRRAAGFPGHEPLPIAPAMPEVTA